jgi:integrase
VVTVEEFSKVYLNEYCEVQNTRPEFKRHALKPIVRLLGPVRVNELSREHGHQYKKERLSETKTTKNGGIRKIKNGTVNREFSVLHNMLTFAVDKGIILVNPLDRFRKLPEPQTVLRAMTLDEERRLIAAIYTEDSLSGIFCAFLGETALRLAEGLRVQWAHIDLRQRLLTVDASKNFKVRYVPLSDYACELLSQITRVLSSPYVFTRLENMERMRAPRAVLDRARGNVGLDWVGFHDFRHFRASQWVMRGVDLRTVQELMGHADIQTTMRYAHFAPSHAIRCVTEAQRKEQQELAAATEAAGQIGNGRIGKG